MNLPREAIGPIHVGPIASRGVRTSISKEAYSHLCFSRVGCPDPLFRCFEKVHFEKKNQRTATATTCHLQITFANSLDLDQDPNCLTL